MRVRAGAALAVLTVLAVLLAQPRTAEAGRGIVIYHSGEDVFPTGPLPEPFNEHPQLKGATAAYKCSIFGLFWAYFHMWNCQPVALKGETFYTDAELTKAIGTTYSEGDMQVGLWTKHGRWVFVAALLGIVAMGLFRRKSDDDEDESEDDQESATT